MNKWKAYNKMLAADFRINRVIYFLAIPMILYYLIFQYFPIFGNIIAFKDFVPIKGILGSPWTSMGGFKHFINFFNSYYFWQLIRNTLVINVYELILAFPAPIIFALLLNELRGRYYKKIVQTAVYLPHFISLVVVCGLIKEFTTTEGFITSILSIFGMEKSNLLMRPELFRIIFVGSGVWQSFGWTSIIYLAALMGIDQELYEACRIDGAGKWRQTLSVTLPGIAPIITIMLILKLGGLFTVGFEKIILLYNPLTYDTADVISSFVYRRGLLDSNFSSAAAIGLFNSVLNLIVLVTANKISAKVSDSQLW